jgi:hypothetical protein
MGTTFLLRVLQNSVLTSPLNGSRRFLLDGSQARNPELPSLTVASDPPLKVPISYSV